MDEWIILFAGVFDNKAVAVDMASSDKCFSDSSSSLSPNLNNIFQNKKKFRNLLKTYLQFECLTILITIKHMPINIVKQNTDVKLIRDF